MTTPRERRQIRIDDLAAIVRNMENTGVFFVTFERWERIWDTWAGAYEYDKGVKS